MKMKSWILAFLLLSAVSAFADVIPGDPQMDPLPCSGSIALTLGANGSLVTSNGPNLSPSTLDVFNAAGVLVTPGVTVCYANHTGGAIGGLSLTATGPIVQATAADMFTCPMDSTLFTVCSTSFAGDSVTFTFLQGKGTGLAGCNFSSDFTVVGAQFCGEFKFTAMGFPDTTTFTAASVPEPSTLVLMMPGVAYMGSQIRRRARRRRD